MKKLLKKHGFAPSRTVTDKLRSHPAAFRTIGLVAEHDRSLRANNRAGNAHHSMHGKPRVPLKWQPYRSASWLTVVQPRSQIRNQNAFCQLAPAGLISTTREINRSQTENQPVSSFNVVAISAPPSGENTSFSGQAPSLISSNS
jgi:hypothetical protein